MRVGCGPHHGDWLLDGHGYGRFVIQQSGRGFLKTKQKIMTEQAFERRRSLYAGLPNGNEPRVIFARSSEKFGVGIGESNRSYHIHICYVTSRTVHTYILYICTKSGRGCLAVMVHVLGMVVHYMYIWLAPIHIKSQRPNTKKLKILSKPRRPSRRPFEAKPRDHIHSSLLGAL